MKWREECTARCQQACRWARHHAAAPTLAVLPAVVIPPPGWLSWLRTPPLGSPPPTPHPLATHPHMHTTPHAHILPLTLNPQTVAENLAAQLSDLRYGHEVERIAWGPAGVLIRCANGVTLEADAAVVTLPLGVLQARHGQLFEPALPPGKVSGADALPLCDLPWCRVVAI